MDLAFVKAAGPMGGRHSWAALHRAGPGWDTRAVAKALMLGWAELGCSMVCWDALSWDALCYAALGWAGLHCNALGRAVMGCVGLIWAALSQATVSTTASTNSSANHKAVQAQGAVFTLGHASGCVGAEGL